MVLVARAGRPASTASIIPSECRCHVFPAAIGWGRHIAALITRSNLSFGPSRRGPARTWRRRRPIPKGSENRGVKTRSGGQRSPYDFMAR